jgi:hypothetical protein
MTISIFYGIAAAIWLFSCGASLLALRWSITAGRRKFAPALIASCLGLATGYIGMSKVRLSASQTTNGHVDWSFNSKWFFLAALILGAVSLAMTLWRSRKQSEQPSSPV